MTETAPLSDLSWTRGYTDPAWTRRFTTSGREISPSRRVWRGAGRPRDLPGRSTSSDPGTHELDTVPLELNGRAAVTLPDLFAAAQTDAFLVLHRGSVVYERYLDGIEGHTPHFNASAAKSYIGLVAAVLAHQGHLDRTLQTSFYVPELAGTAFGEARIEDLLHMGTQVSYGGRRLFVSPGLDLVVVHFGSQVISSAVPAVPFVPAFLQIGAHLHSEAQAATR
ncbi:serine hydrolase [[Kitasatospora] papulosa]|uniref:serine hydrolase n=1 Tax=Streptomyces TaxID=1883 RepID=UPI002FF0F322